MGYRIEKDFLGEKEIPEDAYYGVQTLRGKEEIYKHRQNPLPSDNLLGLNPGQGCRSNHLSGWRWFSPCRRK